MYSITISWYKSYRFVMSLTFLGKKSPNFYSPSAFPNTLSESSVVWSQNLGKIPWLVPWLLITLCPLNIDIIYSFIVSCVTIVYNSKYPQLHKITKYLVCLFLIFILSTKQKYTMLFLFCRFSISQYNLILHSTN